MKRPLRVPLDAIARASGGLAMVAMDQRDSLRTMFCEAGVESPTDDLLVDFKLTVAAELGPLASGFLIDRLFGFHAVRSQHLLPPDTGLILAADALQQQPGGPVEDTDLDAVVIAPDFDLAGVAALKLLVIWRRDDRREHRIELARRFAAAAADRGVVSVLEPVVRATPEELTDNRWNTEEAIAEAARELSVVGQSLYKVQVPLAGRGTAAELERACGAVAASISGPWVVLSQGVHKDDFHGAVMAACRSGASGFLAGRALWADIVGAPDLTTELRARAVPRLERLIETVDRYARPWTQS